MFTDPHLAPRGANFRALTPLDLLARTLEVHGPRPAVAWRDHHMAWDDFGAMVARMAHWLRGRGVGPGDVVSVILSNRPEMLAAHFAVPALGAVLNTINTRLDAGDVAYILDHAGARVLLAETATRPDIDSPILGNHVPVEMLCTAPGAGDGLDFWTGAAPALDLTAAVGDENQAISLNYTSGTTGRPKGVVYTHRGAYLNAVGNVLALGLTADSRYLWTLPLFHCNGWCQAWAVTAAGGMYVCLDRVEPRLILDTLGRHAVTHMSCAPVVLYMLLDHATEAPPVRVRVTTGGAAPTPALLAGLSKLGFDLNHMYGLTESYGPATINDPGDPGADLDTRAALMARQGRRHVTAGRARVVDDTGAEVPADGRTMGEIVLEGNTLMAGYYRNPEATEQAFRGGMFHSGDLAVVHPDGQIEIRDRAKDIIISGGENVSSLEVETVLHRHPDILLAAVVAAPDDKWGETPWAFVEVKDGRTLSEADLEAFCRDHLAGFKRPRRFVFGALPRTATGKIQKFVLRETARGMVSA
ncbi:AMP-binding protein [Rhodobaculum claviforme]|uniref:3-methylmercaptopropionyl-CoA ligase n=1 Tax=Rhodobaculum claviforme TaxID=1549854 RepID=A0A934TH01_9RHOB|nr:AMP-binding protein [Rhodobaculum claviforme]MBK5926255.1 acyl-CoA synthase [Rhodobaculum claviforme]